MRALHNTVRLIDNFTEKTGNLLAWLCLGMAVVSCVVVLLRYEFGIGSIAAQESVAPPPGHQWRYTPWHTSGSCHPLQRCLFR